MLGILLCVTFGLGIQAAPHYKNSPKPSPNSVHPVADEPIVEPSASAAVPHGTPPTPQPENTSSHLPCVSEKAWYRTPEGWTVIVTGLYTIIAGFGLFFAWRQGLEARNAAREATEANRDTLGAVKRQADALEGQNSKLDQSLAIARQSADAAQMALHADRAILIVDQLSLTGCLEKADGKTFNINVRFQIKNLGRTFAVLDSVKIELYWAKRWNVLFNPLSASDADCRKATFQYNLVEEGDTMQSRPYPLLRWVGTEHRIESSSQVFINSGVELPPFVTTLGYFSADDIQDTGDPRELSLQKRGAVFPWVVLGYTDVYGIRRESSFFAWIPNIKSEEPASRSGESALYESHNYWGRELKIEA